MSNDKIERRQCFFLSKWVLSTWIKSIIHFRFSEISQKDSIDSESVQLLLNIYSKWRRRISKVNHSAIMIESTQRLWIFFYSRDFIFNSLYTLHSHLDCDWSESVQFYFDARFSPEMSNLTIQLILSSISVKRFIS